MDCLHGSIVGLAASPRHAFSKAPRDEIMLLQGLGVEGDAHCGVKVKHRHRARKYPDEPNRRQIHLFAEEMLDELAAQGFSVKPGEFGENVLTRGIDLLTLPLGARLYLGEAAVVELTGLRNPCKQIDGFQKGLMQAVLGRDESGKLLLRAGVMGIVSAGGTVRKGDRIRVELPAPPHIPLEKI